MTAAGDAVLAVAYGEVGYVEGANNSTKYWDWYGGNYGAWCGVFYMWCSEMAGYPVCSDCILVSNGTVHGYTTGGSGATGVEAQRTLDLQPGDGVLFSWEPWEFRDGVPTCVGEWDGYPAGDHFGCFAYWVDQGSGRFAAVEGNTSDGSWDNGGMVMLREDRYTSQVCGWWRPERIASGGGGGGTDNLGDFIMDNDELVAQLARIEHAAQTVYWQAGNFDAADWNWAQTINQRLDRIEQLVQSTFWQTGNWWPDGARWDETIGQRLVRIEGAVSGGAVADSSTLRDPPTPPPTTPQPELPQ